MINDYVDWLPAFPELNPPVVRHKSNTMEDLFNKLKVGDQLLEQSLPTEPWGEVTVKEIDHKKGSITLDHSDGSTVWTNKHEINRGVMYKKA